MGYPFYDNPLDDYLSSSFSLKVDEFNLQLQLQEASLEQSERKYLAAQLAEIRTELEQLKSQVVLEPRDFDVFLSEPELAVERFKIEFPEPAPYFQCDHAKQQLTRKIFRDGSVHVAYQCMLCGSNRGAKAKEGLDIDSLPAFDEDLSHTGNAYRSWWKAEKQRIYHEAMAEGNEIPEFDDEEFYRQFEESHPCPGVVGCQHPEIETRLRFYSAGQSAVVEQCQVCGKHLKSIKKPLGWESLPHFDADLQPALEQKISRWIEYRYEAYKAALAAHKRDVQIQIASGEIAVRDNSRFGSYYCSEEWQRTRQRILQRDDHLCQACGSAAECVHHIVYDRLGAENDLDLISLCHSCHDAVHQEQRSLHNLYRMPPSDIRVLRAAI